MGQPRGAENEMEKIVEVGVSVEKGRGKDILYPVVMNYSRNFLLVGPIMGQLIRNMSAYFHCRVQGASQVRFYVLFY